MRIFAMLIGLALVSCGSNTEAENAGEADNKNQAAIQEVKEYHPNGVLEKKGQVLDGKRIGKWEAYYPNGYKWSEMSYKDGYKQGPVITYYDNGMMRYQGAYYNDERAGLWQFYDTTGRLIQKIDMDTVSGKVDLSELSQIQ